jgi:hypothetical protein
MSIQLSMAPGCHLYEKWKMAMALQIYRDLIVFVDRIELEVQVR